MKKRPKTAVCWFDQNKREVGFKIDDLVKHPSDTSDHKSKGSFTH